MNELIDSLKSHYPEIGYGFHSLTTDAQTWESVCQKDSYFSDLRYYDDILEFGHAISLDLEISAVDVAMFFLSFDSYTQLQIQTMVYLAYADYLKLTGKELFREEIEAWEYGPVIRSVYDIFEKYGSDKITDGEIIEQEYRKRTSGPVQAFARMRRVRDSKNILSVLTNIQTNFKKLSGEKLINLTHQSNLPWEHAYESEANNVITNELILKYHDKDKLAI
ncbi:hypothetical protein CL176_09670 [Suicoccus acidiformans]|uniref:Antitoxin SocA-like Panacea domain-containing protein n=1 Tax=Suicoccus acidiformans TaxID=2036206 RepID=A0A347WMD5_9LACT|nr:type II toxin-antitoxin system antitoxin SocA domain-containing protein [Suicoccus acidiformans]AXY26242.1 hypothetical protein CL176_09670 [Suicoccus acidiformans]